MSGSLSMRAPARKAPLNAPLQPIGAKPRTTLLNALHVPTAEELTAELRGLDFEAIGWPGVELKYRELLAMLSAPTSGLNAAQARIQQKEAVSTAIVVLLDLAHAECRRLLGAGRARAAVDGGLTMLRIKKDYYGQGALQLVPTYFHLARTSQYMDQFKRAEEFLSLAQLEIMRHAESDDALKAELHQTYGLLYASDGRLDDALKHLTYATYYLSCLNGPEHVLTSFGYFDIGNVFAATGQMEHAMAFYDKVKEIWRTYLGTALQRVLEARSTADDDDALLDIEAAARRKAAAAATLGNYSPAGLGADNVHDAGKMLRGIVTLQRERFGAAHPTTGRAEAVHGMFLLWVNERQGAFDATLRALEIAKRAFGERHPNVAELYALLRAFGYDDIPDDTSHVLDGGAAPGPSAAVEEADEEQDGRSYEPYSEPQATEEQAPVVAAPSPPPAADAPAEAADAVERDEAEGEVADPTSSGAADPEIEAAPVEAGEGNEATDVGEVDAAAETGEAEAVMATAEGAEVEDVTAGAEAVEAAEPEEAAATVEADATVDNAVAEAASPEIEEGTAAVPDGAAE